MRNILIIGARGSIGSAIVDIFKEDINCKLFLTASSIAGIQEFIAQNFIKQDINTRVFGFACNLLNNEDVNLVFSDVLKVAGKIDILICNAGMNNDKLAIRMTRDDFDKVIQANLISNFIINRDAVKHMLKNNYGRIINISSIIAEIGNVGQANYAASKAGLIAMSKSLALEYAAKGITVNCVAPGFIESEMTGRIPEEIKSAMLAKIPMKCYGKAVDIANIVKFLASDEASYITGQVLHVNGGMLMR